MAGHSKWANIKHRKGKEDAKRGKLFTKLIREITISARICGGDASSNPRLRAAIENALSNNMTRDTIDRAVKRGTGDGEVENLDEVRYEGYGPNGVAIMVDCMTNNRNRTVAEVRHAFSKYGGNMGAEGSVGFLFKKQGVLSYPVGSDEDAIMAAALDSGAEDVVVNSDGSVDVLTSVDDFGQVKDSMTAAGLVPESAEVTMRPGTLTALDKDDAERMLKLLEMLEDLDDVQNVYSNADISDEILAVITG